METSSQDLSLSSHPKLFITVSILFIFAIGIGVRLVNLTNPPLDFHAWRQLRSAAIARGFFYQMMPSADPALRQKAIEIGNSNPFLEPPIFERIVAITYRLVGHEYLWIARLYAIFFWGMGGIGLFLLARKITSAYGALFTEAVYLLIPFGIFASRSFQPDPLMVMWIIWAAYGLYNWSVTKTWKWALLAGVLSGIAVLIKVFAVFPITAMAIGLSLTTWPFRKLIKQPQVWIAAAIMIIIPGIYYLVLMGQAGPEYISGWVLSFSGLLTKGWFYKRWLDMLQNLVDLTLVIIAALSVLLLSGRARTLLIGMWIGYLLIGLSVPSLIISHSYYNLFIVPVIALSLAALGHLLVKHLVLQGFIWKVAFVGVALIGIFYPAWNARTQLVRDDYHNEVLGWIKMGREMPANARIIAISQDYNARLQYYGWVLLQSWPLTGDQQMGVLAGGNMDMNDPYWDTYFLSRKANADYFLITNMAELDSQPRLKANLEAYPFVEGQGYILYDLRAKK
ncbi:MAG TPA: glycosyltransferase family 39 protein [Anaerolineales bacterium]|nr:glycosyltransferase family 39 protein [Anaerolineales bacterium]